MSASAASLANLDSVIARLEGDGDEHAVCHSLRMARDTMAEMAGELERLNVVINTPQADDFLRAVSIEAEHQRQRWGADHDAGKKPTDWLFLLGYLGGKVVYADHDGNLTKAEHHIISSGATCLNWHRAMFGQTDMRPGIDGEKALGGNTQ